MTNQSNKQKSKFPLVIIIFLISLTALTIVRYMQYDSAIIPESGFFMHEKGLLNNLYYILFGISAALMTVFTLIDMKSKRGIRSKFDKNKKIKKDDIEAIEGEAWKKSLGFGFENSDYVLKLKEYSAAFSIIGGILLAACAFLISFDAIDAVERITPKNISIMEMVTLIAALFGFMFVSFTIFTKRKIVPITAISFLFIAACCVSRAASRFMEITYISNLSVNLVSLSANLLFSLFFLNCGRITVQSETRFTALSATIFGYGAVAMVLSDSISRIIYYNSCDSTTRNLLSAPDNGFSMPPSPLMIVMAFTVFWLLLALSSRNKKIGKNGNLPPSKEEEEIDNEEKEVFGESV
ncbi:MAG: hypothetical protein FWF82_06235 [Oscillospiraceae bacterium]|nr:hypothetical protein [Oscillospiraceae bacterium]